VPESDPESGKPECSLPPLFYHCGRPNEKACDSENPGRMQISLERVPDLAPVASRSVIDRAGFSEGHLISCSPRGKGRYGPSMADPSPRKFSPVIRSRPPDKPFRRKTTRMIYIPAAVVALVSVFFLQTHLRPSSHGAQAWTAADTPAQAQVISPKSFAVLKNVPPPTVANGSTVRLAS